MTSDKLSQKVQKIYKKACPNAAALIVSIMLDENVKPEIRLNCAEKILMRAFENGENSAAEDTLNVMMSEEANAYAK